MKAHASVATEIGRKPVPSGTPLARRCACGTHGDACRTCTSDSSRLTRFVESGGDVGSIPAAARQVVRESGRPLEDDTRRYFEERLGSDFSGVRVHTGGDAAEACRMLNASAYTVGRHMVFGNGRFVPQTADGRRLLAHELTHVAQQSASGAAISMSEPRAVSRPHDADEVEAEQVARAVAIGEPRRVSRRPAAVLRREASPQDLDEWKRAKARHVRQQRRVEQLLNEARASTSTKPVDIIVRNSAELILSKRLGLVVLGPTHDYDTRQPPLYAYFDPQVAFPNEGGDYPADPAVKTDKGLTFADSGREGDFKDSVATLYTPTTEVSRYWFVETLVHEGQHFADRHELAKTGEPSASATVLNAYKSEFRAYWLSSEIPVPTVSDPDGFRRIESPPLTGVHEPGLPSNDVVKVDTRNCGLTCDPIERPAPTIGGPAPAIPHEMTQSTNFKTKAQSTIFWHLIKAYPHRKFDCFYVCDASFREQVDRYTTIEGVNLINSLRLVALYDALSSRAPSAGQSDTRKIVAVLRTLDDADWHFLKDTKRSSALWTIIAANVSPEVKAALVQIAQGPRGARPARIERLQPQTKQGQ